VNGIERKRTRGVSRRRLAAAMALAVLAQCLLPHVHRLLSAAAEARQPGIAIEMASSAQPVVRNVHAAAQHAHSEADCVVCQALAHRIGPASVVGVSFSTAAGAASIPPAHDTAPRRAVLARHAPRSPPILA
jgi:hypothetical protein